MHPIEITSNRPADRLEIRWTLNNVCNFNCRYCWPECHAGTYRSPENLEIVIKNFRHMFDYYSKHRNKKRFSIYMSGGEPTLWKELDKFVIEIKKHHDVYFTLVTNGSRTLRWWQEHGKYIDNAHISFHYAQADINHTIAVADALYENGCKTTVKVLMDPQYWDQCVESVEYMKKNSRYPWFIVVIEVIEDDYVVGKKTVEIPRYDKKRLEYLKKDLKRVPGLKWFWKNRKLLRKEIILFNSTAIMNNGIIIGARPGYYIRNGFNNFFGWECDIGLDNINIHFDGSIKASCGTYLFGGNRIYNIKDENFEKIFNPEFNSVVCTKTACWCTPETHENKRKLDNHKSLKKFIPILQIY